MRNTIVIRWVLAPIVVLTMLISLWCRAAAPADDDLQINLRYTRDEVSKDSSTVDYSVTVRGRTVRYSEERWGFRNEGKESFSYTMTPEQLNELKALIRKHRLNRNIVEKKPKGMTGLSVTMTLVIVINGVKTSIDIHGMLNNWEQRSVQPSNIDSLDYCHQAQELLKWFKKIRGTRN